MDTSQKYTSQIVRSPSGMPIYCSACGCKTALPTMVLVHGWFQSHTAFRCLVPYLAPYCQVICLDLPWHGASYPVPTEVTDLGVWADSIQMALDCFGVERYALAGWSFGGWVVASSLEHSGFDNVCGLCLIGAFFSPTEEFYAAHPGELANGFALAAQMTAQHLSFADRHQAMRTFVERLTYQALSASEHERLYGANAQAFLQLYDAGEQLAQALFASCPDFGGVIHEMNRRQIPVLLLQGQEDCFVTPAYSRKIAARLSTGRFCEYTNCGHMPFLERTEAVAFDLVSFLFGLVKEGASHV